MSLFAYIIASVLLSLIGWGIYLLYRRLKPGAAQRRSMIHLIIFVSLALPFSPNFHFSADNHLAQAQVHDAHGINEFCHCSDPNTSDLILYRAHQVYDFMLYYQTELILILSAIALFFVGLTLLRMGALFVLIRRSGAEIQELGGYRYRLIRNAPQLAAGSLRLFGKFIFWNPVLDDLDESEKKAILHHEIAHLRQFNTLEKIGMSLLRGLWFFNPVWSFFNRELELLSEFQADSYASQRKGNAKAYATLLLKVKTTKGLALLHFFSKSKSLKARIHNLMQSQKQPLPRTRRWAPGFIAGILLLFASDFYAQSIISERIRDIRIYQYISIRHEKSGETEFCRKCTLEAVENGEYDCYIDEE